MNTNCASHQVPLPPCGCGFGKDFAGIFKAMYHRAEPFRREIVLRWKRVKAKREKLQSAP